MQICANFTIFSTTLLIGLNIKFYKILKNPLFSNQILNNKNLSESIK